MLVATALVPRSDLVSLMQSLTPLRVTIDEHRERVVTFGRPEVQLVPGRGIRLRGEAHADWDFVGVPVPVTIKVWQLLLVPRVASRDGSHVLSFEPVLEDLELKLVPGFVDEKVADAIRGGIARVSRRLAWDFARTLSKRLPLPAKVSPAKTFEIRAVGGEVSVSESEVLLALRFAARFFEERAAVETEPASETAPVSRPHVIAH